MNYEEHPWLMAIFIASIALLILLSIISLIVGYVVLLQWIYPNSEIAFEILIAFPVLVALIKLRIEY